MNKNFIQKQIQVNCNTKECTHFTTCCKVCTEYYSDNNRVDLLIFGQGCGEIEEKLHRPFVGPAGKRMRQIIAYLWKKHNFTIGFTNNVRCHPINSSGYNCVPTREEVEHCLPHLQEDIITLNPRVIIPVGMSAYGTFYDATDTTMAKVHGCMYPLGGVENKYMPTYHPSYVIRKHGQDSWNENNLTKTDQIIITDIEYALRYI